MSADPQKLKNLSQTATIDANVVSARDHLDYSPPAARAVAFIQRSLWPFMVIAVAALSSCLWAAALFWLLGHVVW